MSSSLSSLVDNLSEGFHSENCADCKSHFDYMSIKDDKLIFRCFERKKSYEKEFSKKLIKRFENVYTFCNKGINKFILLLRKDLYHHDYIDNWKRFDETALLYRHANSVIKKFWLNDLGEYHDLYVIHYYLQMYLKILETCVLKHMI